VVGLGRAALNQTGYAAVSLSIMVSMVAVAVVSTHSNCLYPLAPRVLIHHHDRDHHHHDDDHGAPVTDGRTVFLPLFS
jgi:hypothetical protein